jgi:hypothetical protein
MIDYFALIGEASTGQKKGYARASSPSLPAPVGRVYQLKA